MSNFLQRLVERHTDPSSSVAPLPVPMYGSDRGEGIDAPTEAPLQEATGEEAAPPRSPPVTPPISLEAPLQGQPTVVPEVLGSAPAVAPPSVAAAATVQFLEGAAPEIRTLRDPSPQPLLPSLPVAPPPMPPSPPPPAAADLDAPSPALPVEPTQVDASGETAPTEMTRGGAEARERQGSAEVPSVVSIVRQMVLGPALAPPTAAEAGRARGPARSRPQPLKTGDRSPRLALEPVRPADPAGVPRPPVDMEGATPSESGTRRAAVTPVLLPQIEAMPQPPVANPAPAPTIHVSIGRVEVRASASHNAPRAKPPQPRLMDLETFLARRDGGGRP